MMGGFFLSRMVLVSVCLEVRVTQWFEGGGAFKDGVGDVGFFEECTQHEAS